MTAFLLPGVGRWVLLCSLTSAAVASPVWAQSGDAALAESLYQEGKKLFEEGQFAQACPRFASSHRADPAGGTVLALAHCLERLGKHASAWAAFNEALSLARRDRRGDREASARERIEALSPRVIRLSLRLPEKTSALPGVEILRDGIPLEVGALDAALPVDPGEHEIVVRAPGHAPQTTKILVETPGELREVPLPELEPIPVAVPPASSTSPEPVLPPSRRSPALAYSLGALGAVSLGFGATFGVLAWRQHSDATALCPARPCRSQEASEKNEDARTSANLANLGLGLGVVALGAAAYVYLAQKPSTVGALSPVLGPRSGGVSWGGHF